MSPKRMKRYLDATNGDTSQAMTLYRDNMHTSQTIDTSYILNEYQKIQTLFSWMGIDNQSLLYGLDHVQSVCEKINSRCKK